MPEKLIFHIALKLSMVSPTEKILLKLISVGEKKTRPVPCRKKEEAIVEVVRATKLLQLLSTIILVTAECASKSFKYLNFT